MLGIFLQYRENSGNPDSIAPSFVEYIDKGRRTAVKSDVTSIVSEKYSVY